MFRLGLDIDGCINDLGPLLHRYAEAYSAKYGILKTSDMSDYLIERYFGWNKEINAEFWKTYYRQALNNTSPLPGASQTISLSRRNGVEVFLITGRGEKYRELTNDWLAKHNIKFDNLIMSKDKVEKCIENNIDVMIEDETANCTSIAEKIPVICMSYKYNECLEGSTNIIRVTNWAEIFNEVMSFARKKQVG